MQAAFTVQEMSLPMIESVLVVKALPVDTATIPKLTPVNVSYEIVMFESPLIGSYSKPVSPGLLIVFLVIRMLLHPEFGPKEGLQVIPVDPKLPDAQVSLVPLSPA